MVGHILLFLFFVAMLSCYYVIILSGRTDRSVHDMPRGVRIRAVIAMLVVVLWGAVSSGISVIFIISRML